MLVSVVVVVVSFGIWVVINAEVVFVGPEMFKGD